MCGSVDDRCALFAAALTSSLRGHVLRRWAKMAVVMEYVSGGLTAVSTSLLLVLLMWRLSRHFSLRATRPPCCDVIYLLACLVDTCQALMGVAILVLVVSDDTGCTAAGFLALLGGAQTLCLLAARSVVMTTGHVHRGGSRDTELAGSKSNEKRCSRGWCVGLIVGLVCVVTVICALPLSQLPVATTHQRNHTTYHLACLPLTLESRDTAAWRYSCFLLVAVGWLPVLIATATSIVRCSCHGYRASGREDCGCGSAWLIFSGVLRLTLWTLVVTLVSVELLAKSSVAARSESVQLAMVLVVDLAMLMHVLHDVLHVHERYVTHRHHHHQHQLPEHLTVVTRTHQLLVCTVLYSYKVAKTPAVMGGSSLHLFQGRRYAYLVLYYMKGQKGPQIH